MVNILIQRYLDVNVETGIASLANRIDGDLASEPKFPLGTTGS
jgi:hypothetical protein